MFPIAGVIIWIVLGSVIGWLGGKITHTSFPNGVMSNTGIGMLAAVLTGFVISIADNGDRSPTAFWVAIAMSGLSAVLAVSVYRVFVPGHSATMR